MKFYKIRGTKSKYLLQTNLRVGANRIQQYRNHFCHHPHPAFVYKKEKKYLDVLLGNFHFRSQRES